MSISGTTIANNDKPSVGGSKAVTTNAEKMATLRLLRKKLTESSFNLIRAVKIIGY